MSYRGLMEGWEPDECTGNCGTCEECYTARERYADSEYDACCDEKLEYDN